jgi:CobQ-like glutamine amidotransferase family enzyme
MEYKTFVLKDNSEEIRKKIKDAGICVCVCASFEKACWLDYHTSIANGVHGVGYHDDVDGVTSQEEELARFVSECKNMVVCKDVDEFINSIKDFENGNKIE